MTICANCKHGNDFDEDDWYCFNTKLVGISPVTGGANFKPCAALNFGNCEGFEALTPEKQIPNETKPLSPPWWKPWFLRK